jgi:mannose/fructose/N-acetylgalactosamine-specific phosphotransferase system component IIC
MRWYFLQLPILCAIAAFIDLDDYHIGQWMVSRPIVLGPLLGSYLGKLGMGVWIGAVLELLTLDDLPIGHSVPVNGAIATAFALIICAGKWRAPLPAAIAGGILLGFAFRKIESAIRFWRQNFVRRAEGEIERGKRFPSRFIAESIAAHFTAVAGFLYVTTAAAGPILADSWQLLPQEMRVGLDLAVQAAPWLGIATLIHIFRPR